MQEKCIWALLSNNTEVDKDVSQARPAAFSSGSSIYAIKKSRGKLADELADHQGAIEVKICYDYSPIENLVTFSNSLHVRVCVCVRERECMCVCVCVCVCVCMRLH